MLAAQHSADPKYTAINLLLTSPESVRPVRPRFSINLPLSLFKHHNGIMEKQTAAENQGEVYISFNPFVSTISGHLCNLMLLWALSKSVNFSTEAAGFALFSLVPTIIWTIHAFPYLFHDALIHDQTFLFMEFLKFLYVGEHWAQVQVELQV